MELKFFPVGAYVKLQKGKAWLEIVAIKKNIYHLQNTRTGKKTICGDKKVVVDWLVGKNSSTSKAIDAI